MLKVSSSLPLSWTFGAELFLRRTRLVYYSKVLLFRTPCVCGVVSNDKGEAAPIISGAKVGRLLSRVHNAIISYRSNLSAAYCKAFVRRLKLFWFLPPHCSRF